MKNFLSPSLLLAVVIAVGLSMPGVEAAEPPASKHILFLAGANSHGWGSHKHIAGTTLLSSLLPQGAPNVTTEMVKAWPSAGQLEKADALVIYADGWGAHPANGHLEELKAFMDKGKGLVVLHWATGIGAAKNAGKEQGEDPNRIQWRKLMGADFEAFYSISNFYTANFKHPAEHPVTNGVTPFNLYDECYYHLRECGATHGKIDRILPLHPPASTIQEGLSPYRGNDIAREAIAKKEEQYCAWTYERPGGGRAFGFTGGHFHWSWARDEVRKLVMNGFVWAAGGEVPETGVETPRPTASQMLENMGVPNPGWEVEELQKALDLAQAGTTIPWGKFSRGKLVVGDKKDGQAVAPFDGKTLKGWEVNKGEEKWWRVKDGAIEGGSLEERVPHNTFITTVKSYQNFELRLKMKITPVKGGVNSGIQIRSVRVPDHHEMIGYQADAGGEWWGKLYDESRRRVVIGEPGDPGAVKKAVRPTGWNDYRIRCEGPRIRTWLNGVASVDYTEEDAEIPLEGKIGLQVHGGGTLTVQFKDLTITELPATEGVKTWEGVSRTPWTKKK